jgi:hypothetical protein
MQHYTRLEMLAGEKHSSVLDPFISYQVNCVLNARPCPALPCLALPCPALPCPALPFVITALITKVPKLSICVHKSGDSSEIGNLVVQLTNGLLKITARRSCFSVFVTIKGGLGMP